MGGKLNEKQDEGFLHVRVEPGLSGFSITGAGCTKVYAVLYVIDPYKTLTQSALSAIYITANFICLSH